jgi:DNA topoisomerase VI B subunit
MRNEASIKPPNAACLSPAGEYNMRLGVLKEMLPKLVATFTDKPGSHEGHPFIVEAAVSVGGGKEGLTVHRFANRIPLLFETGADVVSQVASKKIAWQSYHIDIRKECVGVYVSIVSTKIPFKGTSKEYIGEDVTEIQNSVRRAIVGCCQQLRVSLAQNKARREEQERKKTLEKYIPDVSKSLMTVLEKMDKKRKLGEVLPGSHAKGLEVRQLLDSVYAGTLSKQTLSDKLQSAVDHLEVSLLLNFFPFPT